MNLKIWPWENEDGVKLSENDEYEIWLDKSSTQYLHAENHNGKHLKGCTVGIARLKSTGEPDTRIIFNEKGIPIYEAQSIEAIGIMGDCLKAFFTEEENN